MEKKNMVLLTVIAVATLLVAVVGATFAYFSISTTNNFGGGTSDQGKTNITASDAANADAITITESSEAGSFTTEGVYPGHKEVAAIKVNAKSAQGTVPSIKITYNTTKNEFADGSLKISLYKKDTEVTINDNYFACTKKSVNSKLYEECANDTDNSGLGTEVTTVNLLKATTAYTLTASNAVNVSTAGADTFYYVVVEFINTDANQNTDASGKALNGQVKVEVV